MAAQSPDIAQGVDAVLDDRGERPGAMFADWELIGIPLRAVFSDRGLKAGTVEIQGRRDPEAQSAPAGDVLAEIAAEVAHRFGVIAVAVAHRTGPLEIGDCALAAAASAAHRGDAFAACTALVEEVKARIPVWKHQYFADGTDEWVNCA